MSSRTQQDIVIKLMRMSCRSRCRQAPIYLNYVRKNGSFSDICLKVNAMSVTESIQRQIAKVPQGEPFTNSRFLRLGSRAAVDKALSRLVEEGAIQRVARGVFVRPKQSRFVGNVMPDVSRVVEVIARDHGETIQVHGAEAARRFKLSTQMPTTRSTTPMDLPVKFASGILR